MERRWVRSGLLTHGLLATSAAAAMAVTIAAASLALAAGDPSRPATQPAAGPASRPATEPADPGEEVAKLLRGRKIPRLDLKDAPLEDAIRTCGQACGLEIEIKWRQAERLGVKKGTRITFNTRNATAYHVLALILNDAGGPGALLKCLQDNAVAARPAEAASQPTTRPAGDPALPAVRTPPGGSDPAPRGDPNTPAASRPAEPTSQPADPEAVRKALNLADVYQSNRLYAKAAEILRRIIKDNPDTAAALEARKRLGEMGMKE